MSRRSDDIPELLIDTKQHLELISRGWNFQIANDSECLPHHQLIMRGDANIGAVPQHFLEKVSVIAIDHPHVMIRDLPRLDIDAFAEPVIWTQLLERADIVGSSPEVSLNDDTHIGMVLAELTINLQSIGCAGGILHIDPDEILQLACMLDEPLRQIKTRRKIDFQSELRQFYGNIAIELPAIDGVEHSDVSGGGAACLIEVVDMFAKDVECGAESAFVETGNDPQRVVDGFSCDIPIGDSSNNSSCSIFD